jgi:hypothetical protein
VVIGDSCIATVPYDPKITAHLLYASKTGVFAVRLG